MLGIDGGESELIESKGVKGMVVLHATGETMVAQLTQVVLEEEQIACVEKLVGVEHVGHEIAGMQTGEAAREAFGASDEVVISDVGGDATSRSGNSRGGSACGPPATVAAHSRSSTLKELLHAGRGMASGEEDGMAMRQCARECKAGIGRESKMRELPYRRHICGRTICSPVGDQARREHWHRHRSWHRHLHLSRHRCRCRSWYRHLSRHRYR